MHRTATKPGRNPCYPRFHESGQLAILRKMLMIRRAEEHCICFNDEHTGLIRGHFHVYIGQEATGVSVCDWLNADDYVFTTHRNHGHVIAKGGEPKKVLAEIIGLRHRLLPGTRRDISRRRARSRRDPHLRYRRRLSRAGRRHGLRGPSQTRARRSPWSSSATAPWKKACFTKR